ncbi:Ferredoxin--NADP reductase, Pyridine nucleotide-disulfide oxidoreductase [Thermobacillus xylanilyticus]|uniref:Ferredoxin--NADP reductase n=1 Tax=Thermobacillus xylanilyticus TaxID=76633 RepID=A0ABN7S3V3_THEXY|nr:NAD(P)/FAD-dependent oxidoreductase [Thermobacillus xylanilyticus]CAG5091780.1 Ferredoxin--NADP reductase, Pyridine nucleotide-disulfide oxidoreductase [Thermobacillus xylanilyticus]
MSQQTHPNLTDIVIVGGGPVGMFAAFYGGMRQATVKIIESMPQLGGQLSALYPEKEIFDVAGFPRVKAQKLVDRLREQLDLFKPEICLEEKVLNVRKIEERLFEVTTDRTVHHARAVIITAGVGAFEPRKLELPGAEAYEGVNLHYFVNDMEKFRDKRVLISGGGDSAVDWALMLEPIASSVTLVHRRDKFRAHEHSVEKLKASSVNIITPAEIEALSGSGRIERVTLKHGRSGETTEHEVDAVIVSFGFVSSLGPIEEWGLQIESGSIVVDSRMETSIPGIFAAGDIVTYPGKLKLIAVGFGEAPTAINNAKVYIDPTAKLSPGHSSNMKL